MKNQKFFLFKNSNLVLPGSLLLAVVMIYLHVNSYSGNDLYLTLSYLFLFAAFASLFVYAKSVDYHGLHVTRIAFKEYGFHLQGKDTSENRKAIRYFLDTENISGLEYALNLQQHATIIFKSPNCKLIKRIHKHLVSEQNKLNITITKIEKANPNPFASILLNLKYRGQIKYNFKLFQPQLAFRIKFN